MSVGVVDNIEQFMWFGFGTIESTNELTNSPCFVTFNSIQQHAGLSSIPSHFHG